MTVEALTVQNNDQKLFALKLFLKDNSEFELDDLYNWLYYGEFGAAEQKSYLKEDKGIPELQKILDDIKSEEKIDNLTDLVWNPLGLSLRFVMVYLTMFHKRDCPLKRLINLMERSPAYGGTRMHFKLDWTFIKDYLIKNDIFTKQNFYDFEDKIGFHGLPKIPFTKKFIKHHPEKYRIVPRKLFFDFFPEFNDMKDILPTRPRDSLLD